MRERRVRARGLQGGAVGDVGRVPSRGVVGSLAIGTKGFVSVASAAGRGRHSRAPALVSHRSLGN